MNRDLVFVTTGGNIPYDFVFTLQSNCHTAKTHQVTLVTCFVNSHQLSSSLTKVQPQVLPTLWCTMSCMFVPRVHLQLRDCEHWLPIPGALEPTCPSRTWTVPTEWRDCSLAKLGSIRECVSLSLSTTESVMTVCQNVCSRFG